MLLEGRMVELNLEIHLEAVIRIEARPLFALLDAYALQDTDEAFRSLLFLDSGRLQQEHERSGATVHDRHFGSADFDQRIIDP